MGDNNREKLNMLFKPLFFAFSALVALISVTVAWFAANSRVGSQGLEIELAGAKYELAGEGEEGLYYVPGKAGETVTIDGKTLYRTSETQTAITWMIGAGNSLHNASGDVGTLSPGASGKLTFYILPREDNQEEFTVKISINKLLYARGDAKTDVSIVDKSMGGSERTVYLEALSSEREQEAKQLLEGHLLFFTDYNAPYYSGWISDGTLEVPVKGNAPIPVTIYWVWPYMLDWLADTGMAATLCDSSLAEGDYQRILQDMQENPSCYLRKVSGETQEDNSFEPGRLTENYDLYSLKYNRGDEFIGTHVQYLFLEIQAQ